MGSWVQAGCKIPQLFLHRSLALSQSQSLCLRPDICPPSDLLPSRSCGGRYHYPSKDKPCLNLSSTCNWQHTCLHNLFGLVSRIFMYSRIAVTSSCSRMASIQYIGSLAWWCLPLWAPEKKLNHQTIHASTWMFRSSHYTVEAHLRPSWRPSLMKLSSRWRLVSNMSPMFASHAALTFDREAE